MNKVGAAGVALLMQRVAIIAALMCASVACDVERFKRNEEALLGSVFTPPPPAQLGELNVRDGRVVGDIGVVDAFDADAQELNAQYDPETVASNVTLQATDADGRVGMIILNVTGADLRTLPPGAYAIGAPVADSRPLPLGVLASVTGCSQTPDCGTCNYDQPSDRGVVIIEEPREEECDEPERHVRVLVDLPATDESGIPLLTTTAAEGSFTVR